MQNSVWANGPALPEFPRLMQDLKTEVLIVGGGMAGILCAHMLAQEGVSCTLIEADRICCGVTRNTTAKITSQHGLVYSRIASEFGADTARAYWEAQEAALQAYRELAEQYPCDLETKDHYVYAMESPRKLERELQALSDAGIPGDFVDKLPLPFETAGAVRFRNQAQFHPLKLIAQLAQPLRIYEHTPAREFLGNVVLTDHGTITAQKIIIATHFPLINKHGSYFLKLYQHRSYVLAMEHAVRLDGMYLDESGKGFSFRNYGDALLLGGGSHRTGKHGGGWEELEAFKKRYYPDASVMCRWATQDCMSLDGIPYIGRYSSRTPDLYVTAGFNKWGMTSSMAAAMILRDLVQERENPYEQVFSPSRTILRPQLLINGVEAVGNLLTPTRPRCPHMGCALKWNRQERSWDCPCHGSRFAEDGTLLDNPATADKDFGTR